MWIKQCERLVMHAYSVWVLLSCLLWELSDMSAPFVLLSKSIECAGIMCKWFFCAWQGGFRSKQVHTCLLLTLKIFPLFWHWARSKLCSLGPSICAFIVQLLGLMDTVNSEIEMSLLSFVSSPITFLVGGKDASGNLSLSRKIRILINKLCCFIVGTSTFGQFWLLDRVGIVSYRKQLQIRDCCFKF